MAAEAMKTGGAEIGGNKVFRKERVAGFFLQVNAL